MLDFEGLRWDPEPGVLVEAGYIPQSWPAGGRRMSAWRNGAFVLCSAADGSTTPGQASQPTAYPGDRVVLFDDGRLDIDLVTTGADGGRLSTRLVVSVWDAVQFVSWFAPPGEGAVSGSELGQRLGNDPAVSLALAAGGREAIEAGLRPLLSSRFGLNVHTVSEPVVEAEQPAVAALPRRGEVVGGHWRLERRLGGGSFGQVWLAVHTGNAADRRAIKFALTDDATALEMLQREAEAGAELSSRADHRHLVVQHDH